ncbi:hypothetical protein ACFLWX_00285 [Chloroflexota bacterium]
MYDRKSRNRVKRRGRKPVLPHEQKEMIELYKDGFTLKEVGRKVGRHYQTVEKYVRKHLAEEEGQYVHREALREALMRHFGDMVATLESLQKQLVIPGKDVSGYKFTEDPRRGREALLINELRQVHASDSELWSLWDSWESEVRDFVYKWTDVRERLDRDLRDTERYPQLDVAYLEESCKEVILNCVWTVVQSGEQTLGDNFVIKDGGLWWGTWTRLSDGGEPEVARELVLLLITELSESEEVVGMNKLNMTLRRLSDSIREEIDILVLRRVFPGRCRLCPV